MATIEGVNDELCNALEWTTALLQTLFDEREAMSEEEGFIYDMAMEALSNAGSEVATA